MGKRSDGNGRSPLVSDGGPVTQRSYIYEKNDAFHVRYYVEEAGERKQKSHRLCTKDRATGHGSKSATPRSVSGRA